MTNNPIPIPRKIGVYRITRLIGEGGMGRVLLAEDPQTDKHVAIKHMHPNLLRVSNYRQRFEREMEIMTYLSHPNLMPLLDRGEVGDIPFYVMPYIDGMSIRDYLRDYGALTPEQVMPVLNGICAALTYMHSHSVYHRDIKPHNILLDRNGKPILTDFGIAADYNADTKLTNTIQRAGLGTDGYIAPELRGGAFASPRTDVYSLGMTVYEMLARRSLFEALSDDVSNPMAPIPEPLHFVIKRAIEQTPRSRYQKVEHFLMDFRSVVEFEHDSLGHTPVAVPPRPNTNTPQTNTSPGLLTPAAFPDKQKENHIVAFIVTGIALVLVLTIYMAARFNLDDEETIPVVLGATQPAMTEEATEPVTEEVTDTPTLTATPTVDITGTFEVAFFQALTATASVSTATADDPTPQDTRPAPAVTMAARLGATDDADPSSTPTVPAPTPEGIPQEGQTLYTQTQTNLYERVNGPVTATLERGASVLITTDNQGQRFFDVGETRYFAVRAQGSTGWVQAEDLSLERPRDDSSPVPVVSDSQEVTSADPAESPEPGVLGVGMTVRTTEEVYAVNLPGSSISVDLLMPGAFVTITEGPREAGGETWWRVLTPSNSDGWIRAAVLEP